MGRRKRKQGGKADHKHGGCGDDDKEEQKVEQQNSSTTATTKEEENPQKKTKGSDLPDPISKIRLEAIFHPKFENEKSDHQIREEMLNRVDTGKGYLEVSLKHSGSLVLWSGGNRFYSKNSTDNQFTFTAEIILRQHFERAWRNSHGSPDSKYDECSKYAEAKRLTMAFELVTSVLGDHGDIPNRDFAVLTAVADRENERFYTTTEIIQFAQRFRLPHNDTWMFSSLSSAEALFRLYDNNMEIGLATDTVESLTNTAEAHVPSMYPHIVFQGDILEGYIVRFVPFRNEPVEQVLDSLVQLANEAKSILEQVPPELPPSFEVDSILKNQEPVLSVNIRDIFQSVKGLELGRGAGQNFSDKLRDELDKIGSRRKIEKVDRKHIDLPNLTKELTKSIDMETQRIAHLLQKLTKFSKAVTYGFFEEEKQDGKGPKHICVIHILYDEAFLKFQKEMKPGDMALFRGFSIELSGEDPKPVERDTVASLPETSPGDGGSLMLKKKLLPYMVRTFICRNCLRIAKEKGTEAFVTNAAKLFDRWGISSLGKEKWMPFFEAWADYAISCLQFGGDPSLPPISEFSYLLHLEHFTKLYERGELKKTNTSSFRGVVCIVAAKESRAKKFAEYCGNALDGAVPHPINLAAARSILRGAVCYSAIDGTSRGVRPYLEEVSKYSTIVLLGCSNEEIESELIEEPASERKKKLGMRKFWDKAPFAARVALPLSILSDSENITTAKPFVKLLEQVNSLTSSTSEAKSSNTSRGIVIFFPGTPGCGKSTMVSFFEQGFKNFRSSEATKSGEPGNSEKNILVRVGDEIGKSYWSTLKKDMRHDPSCLLIADKNTPPPSWNTVIDLCDDSGAVPIAVFPDGSALQTTELTGMRKPDGSFEESTKHFYPFSLAYLAVCISRVLTRKANSHPGKLDSGTPTACMIVILFYSLYRSMSADTLKEMIEMKMTESLGRKIPPPVEIPFFEGQVAPTVPQDLHDVLVEALQLQFGYDVCKRKVKPKNEDIVAMESRLRAAFEKHSEFFLSKTMNIEKTRESFYAQISDRVTTVNNMMDTDLETNAKSHKEKWIKLVSLDVDKAQVHKILNTHATGESKPFLDIVFGGLTEDVFKSECYPGDDFVNTTHVTMAFCNTLSQAQMRERFEPLLGCEVDLLVTGILWNNKIAAFAVTLPETTKDGQPLPKSENSFVHITIWVSPGSKSKDSNDLPDLVAKGRAQQVEFQSAVLLSGKISFWSN